MADVNNILTCTPFSANSTNIFPIANSTTGGQLLTEYNLKSRESVGTNSAITYPCGLSYAHGESDFALAAVDGNSSQIKVNAGRAVVDGHFIESLAPVYVDIAALNSNAAEQDMDTTLTGKFYVGLRIIYSTDTTMWGAILPEHQLDGSVTVWTSDGTTVASDYFAGVQLVIGHNLITPVDSPTDRNNVNCHLILGWFNYKSGKVIQVTQNPNKLSMYDSSRIYDLRNALNNEGVLIKPTVDPNMLYVYSPKTENGDVPGWCKAASALMIWDKEDNLETNKVPIADYTPIGTAGEAEFKQFTNGVGLVVPHKPVDGTCTWKDKVYALPNANYATGAAGVVTKAYTDKIKAIGKDISYIKQSGVINGKFRMLYDTMNWSTTNSSQRDNLPAVIPTGWQIGDYVLVRNDYTVADSSGVATMYVIEGGLVTELKDGSATKPTTSTTTYHGNLSTTGPYTMSGNVTIPAHDVTVSSDSQAVSFSPFNTSISSGTLSLRESGSSTSGTTYDIGSSATSALYGEATATLQNTQVHIGNQTNNSLSGNITLNDTVVSLKVPTVEPAELMTLNIALSVIDPYPTPAEVLTKANEEASSPLAGRLGDYVKVVITWTDDETTETRYYEVKTIGTITWSAPIQLSAPLQIATESLIGGFYNIDPSSVDSLGQGYVYADDDGHLRIADFDILAGRTLAYALNYDWRSSSGLDRETLQQELDDYINNRVAFPINATDPGLYSLSSSYVINIVINLSLADDTGDTPLYIHNIDSRFNTAIHITFTGTVGENTKICILDCPRVIIDSESTPDEILSKIYVKRCGLYYDANLLDQISIGSPFEIDNTGANIQLWTLDPNLSIADNVVTYLGSPTAYSIESEVIGTDAIATDVHINYYVQGIAFDTSCNIIGMTMAIADNINVGNMNSGTSDVTYLFGTAFTLPQTPAFNIPETKFIRSIRIDGTYMSMYNIQGTTDYVVKTNNICIYTGSYDALNSVVANGQLVFKSDVSRLPMSGDLAGSSPIDATDNGAWHIICGGTYKGSSGV